MKRQSFIPPAWDYNPSTWKQRIPLVAIGLIGLGVSLYLAAYQLQFIQKAWDPFFRGGTEKVLTSPLSKKFPVPDALLGAFGYLMDVVSGVIGGEDRWKTKPWIVILFGIAVGPLGLSSIFLVIAQPVIVGAWCTLCLCSALISVIMISPALDELLASLQYLQRIKKSHLSLWKAFWGHNHIYKSIK